MFLICLCGAWIAGIFIGSQFDLPLACVFFGLAPIPLLLFHRYRKKVILVSLCIFIFFGGAFCFQSSLPSDDEDYLGYYNDTGTITFKGTVSRDADVRDKTTHLRLSKLEIEIDGEWRDIRGGYIAVCSQVPGIRLR